MNQTPMVEFKVISTGDPKDYEARLNQYSREGYVVALWQINNAPGCPLPPFNAVMTRQPISQQADPTHERSQ